MGKWIPYAVARGPLGDYVAAPAYAFDPKHPEYPLLKKHEVVAEGTAAECRRGVLLIKQREKSIRAQVGVDEALQILDDV